MIALKLWKAILHAASGNPFIDPGWISLALSIVGWIAMLLWNAFRGGAKAGELKGELKNDLEAIKKKQAEEVKKMEDFRKEETQRWEDFNAKFTRFRIIIAKELGIDSGGD